MNRLISEIYEDGCRSYNAGDFPVAEGYFTTVVQTAPQYVDGQVNLAYSRCMQGKIIEALKTLQEASDHCGKDDPLLHAGFLNVVERALRIAVAYAERNFHHVMLEILHACAALVKDHGGVAALIAEHGAAAKQAALNAWSEGNAAQCRVMLHRLADLVPGDAQTAALLRIADWEAFEPGRLRVAPTATPETLIFPALRQMAAAMPHINARDGHHPVFDRYHLAPSFRGPVFETNFLGARTRNAYDEPYGGPAGDPRHYASGKAGSMEGALYPPQQSEDYIEWIDLLEAIDAAEDEFVVAELGAGYGRWLVNAAAGVRRHKTRMHMPYTLYGVEAHPIRFDWMRRTLEDNDVEPGRCALKKCGVSGSVGALYFPDVSQHYRGDSRMHYGARLYSPEELGVTDPSIDRFSYTTNNEAVTVYDKIETLPIERVVDKDRIIDLMDIDIQGAEQSAVPLGIDYLNNRVRKLHVGTHSRDIDRIIYTVMRNNGWTPIHVYANNSENETPWGKFFFGDGVQTWINPRLRRPPAA